MAIESQTSFAHGDMAALRRRLTVAGLAFLLLLATGMAGYRIVDPSVSMLDALYMTVITLTTVGFTEVVDLSNSPGGRLFTVMLLLFGLGVAAYLVSTATAFVIEGDLGRVFWRRRMEKRIGQLSGHQVVCGSGETALQATSELSSVGHDAVLICDREERRDEVRARLPDIPLVVGDPTSASVQAEAGVERAAGLLACTDSDKDNVLITLTGRLANPKLRIVARATRSAGVEQQLRQAGADSVVSPNLIGGLRMASELIRPTVVSFLDQMLRDRDRNLRVGEVRVPAGAPVVGTRLEDIDFRSFSNALLLACRMGGDGGWVYNPPGSFALDGDTTLILMGSPEDLERVRAHLVEAEA